MAKHHHGRGVILTFFFLSVGSTVTARAMAAVARAAAEPSLDSTPGTARLRPRAGVGGGIRSLVSPHEIKGLRVGIPRCEGVAPDGRLPRLAAG
jgi:hypothetical protein